MNASKRIHTPSPDENENKRTRDESPEILPTIHTYNETEVDDVYTTNGIPEPRRARTDTEDWDDPIVLVVSRKTRDIFLKNLGNLVKEIPEVKTPTRQQQQQTTTSHETSESHKSETTDKKTAQAMTEYYKDTTHRLNNATSQYTDEQLKQNLTPEQDLSKFRQVRRALTHFRVSGTKTLNMIQQFENGKTHSLINTEIHFVPNKLQQSTIDEIKHKISNSVTEANAMMFNENVKTLSNNIENVITLLRNTEPIIVAKAWRVVRRTIKPNLQFSFEPDMEYTTETEKDTYRRTRPTDYNPLQTRMNRQTQQHRGKYTYHNTYKRQTSPERNNTRYTDSYYNTDRQQYHRSKPTEHYRKQPQRQNNRTDSYIHQYHDQDHNDYRRQYYRHAPRYGPKPDYRHQHTYETDDNEDHVFYNKEQPHKYRYKHNYRNSQTEPDSDSPDEEHTDTDRYNTDFPPLPPPKSIRHLHLNHPYRP